MTSRPLICASLFLVLAASALSQPTLGLPTIVPSQPVATLVQRAVTAPGLNAIEFDLPAIDDGSLVFSGLRTTAALSAIALVDPAGRTLWRRKAKDLLLLPSSQAKSPELGDSYSLPPVLKPIPGRWHLVLDLKPSDLGPTTALFTYSLNPRYTLALWTHPDVPAVGQPQLLTLRPSESGAPIAARLTVSVNVLDALGQSVFTITADPRLPTPAGLQPVTEPGVYFAQWAPSTPGRYRIQATWQPAPGQTPLVLVKDISVPSSEANIQLLGVTTEVASQCTQALYLAYELRLSAPPSSGATHALLTQLTGPLGSRQISVSADFIGPLASPRLRVSASTLRSLGWPHLSIQSSRLLRLAPDLKLLVASQHIDLGTTLASSLPLCH